MAGAPCHWVESSASAAGAAEPAAAGAGPASLAAGAAPASLAAARERRSWHSEQTVWPCHGYACSRRPIFRSQLSQMPLGSVMAWPPDEWSVARVVRSRICFRTAHQGGVGSPPSAARNIGSS